MLNNVSSLILRNKQLFTVYWKLIIRSFIFFFFFISSARLFARHLTWSHHHIKEIISNEHHLWMMPKVFLFTTSFVHIKGNNMNRNQLMVEEEGGEREWNIAILYFIFLSIQAENQQILISSFIRRFHTPPLADIVSLLQ